jgi:hypothetical protein
MAREILEYLSGKPNANDTLEGIVEWWLTEQRIKRALSETRAALGELVRSGWVIAEQRKDGRTHYRSNPQKKREISQFLKKTKSSG